MGDGSVPTPPDEAECVKLVRNIRFNATFIHSFLYNQLPSRILTCTALKGHWRSFALVSFFLATCAR